KSFDAGISDADRRNNLSLDGGTDSAATGYIADGVSFQQASVAGSSGTNVQASGRHQESGNQLPGHPGPRRRKALPSLSVLRTSVGETLRTRLPRGRAIGLFLPQRNEPSGRRARHRQGQAGNRLAGG